jgi:vacuolar-type H+-ATPase subunit H
LIAAISQIKTAEDAGEAVLKKAAEQAQEIIRGGQAAARDRSKAIRDETRQKRDGILAQARAEAEAACEPLGKEADEAVQRILKPDAGAFNAAVDALVAKLAG